MFSEYDSGGGALLKDEGDGVVSNYYDTPEMWTVEHIKNNASETRVFNGATTITGKTVWQPADNYDSGTVDIGYHHPRVDYYVPDNLTFSDTSELIIKPGTVVALGDGTDSAILTTNGKLKCDGAPFGLGYIHFIYTPLLTARLDATDTTSATTYRPKIIIDGNEDVTMSFTHILELERLGWAGGGNFDYHDNIIERNFRYGLYVYSGCHVDVFNNLFEFCIEAILSYDDITVNYCTFGGNEKYGVRLYYTDSTVVTNNCFFWTANAIYHEYGSDPADLTENNNWFYYGSASTWSRHHRQYPWTPVNELGLNTSSDIAYYQVPNVTLASSDASERYNDFVDFDDRYFWIQEETNPINTSGYNNGSDSCFPYMGYTTDPARVIDDGDSSILGNTASDIGYHYPMDVDDDNDGYYLCQESRAGTSDGNIDSDGDGLVDGWGGQVSTSTYPAGIDADNDGFVDGEAEYGTDPTLSDSDGDNIPDGWELQYGLNPLEPDSDNDGINDGEDNFGEDSYCNIVEYIHGTDPTVENETIAAGEINLSPDSTITIQSAIAGSITGDQIVLAEGIYSSQALDFAGKAITIRSSNPSDPDIVAATIIAGDGSNPAVVFSEGEGSTSILSGITVSNGGYGIHCFNNSTPLIQDCIINNNSTGIFATNSSQPEISNCVIHDNLYNGVIINGASAAISNCNIYRNSAHGISILNPVTPENEVASIIRNCTLTNNMNCGVFWNNLGVAPEISNCLIWANIGDDLTNATASYSCIEDTSCVSAGDTNIITNPLYVGPLVYWGLDDGEGATAADEIGCRDATIYGNASWAEGRFAGDSALEFDGTDDYIDCGSFNSLNFSGRPNFSIVAWIYLDVIEDYDTIICNSINGQPTGTIFNFGFFANNLRVYWGDGTDKKIFSSQADVLTTGIWTHVAAVANGSDNTLKIYVNGQQSGTTGVIDRDLVESTINFQIGRGYNNNNYLFDGKMSEIGIYGRSLSDLEISELHTQTTPVKADYHLMADSPCIDSENPTAPSTDELDIDGEPRVMRGGKVDIGADEFPRVHNLDQDTWFCHIQKAINLANNGDEILVYEGIYYENIDFYDLNLYLHGEDADDIATVAGTVIDGSESDGQAVVTFVDGQDSSCTLEGFTVRGSNIGIFANGTSPNIIKCVVRENSTAGITCVNSSAPIIENTILADNIGSGVQCSNRSAPAINNCTISNNSVYGVYRSEGTISNSIIWYNGADLIGCYSNYSSVGTLDYSEDDGAGNIQLAPNFVDAASGNYLLQTYSGCIDKGDPCADCSVETSMGGEPPVNLGAYGNTPNAAIYTEFADGDRIGMFRPLDGQTNVSCRPILRWDNVYINGENGQNEVYGYQVRLGTMVNDAFVPLIDSIDIISETKTLIDDDHYEYTYLQNHCVPDLSTLTDGKLDYETTYYWCVDVRVDDSTLVESTDYWSFTTVAVGQDTYPAPIAQPKTITINHLKEDEASIFTDYIEFNLKATVLPGGNHPGGIFLIHNGASNGRVEIDWEGEIENQDDPSTATTTCRFWPDVPWTQLPDTSFSFKVYSDTSAMLSEPAVVIIGEDPDLPAGGGCHVFDEYHIHASVPRCSQFGNPTWDLYRQQVSLPTYLYDGVLQYTNVPVYHPESLFWSDWSNCIDYWNCDYCQETIEDEYTININDAITRTVKVYYHHYCSNEFELDITTGGNGGDPTSIFSNYSHYRTVSEDAPMPLKLNRRVLGWEWSPDNDPTAPPGSQHLQYGTHFLKFDIASLTCIELENDIPNYSIDEADICLAEDGEYYFSNINTYGGGSCQNGISIGGSRYVYTEEVEDEEGNITEEPAYYIYVSPRNDRPTITFDDNYKDDYTKIHVDEGVYNADIPKVIYGTVDGVVQVTLCDPDIHFESGSYTNETSMLSCVVTQYPKHGHLSDIPSQGCFRYTPVAYFQGDDRFVYRVFDGTLGPVVVVDIKVNDIEDIPTAEDDAYEIRMPYAGNLQSSPGALDVMSNDYSTDGISFEINRLDLQGDSDGDPLSALVNIERNANGQGIGVLYTPFAHGRDTFGYMLLDENGLESWYGQVDVVVKSRPRVAWDSDFAERAHNLQVGKPTVLRAVYSDRDGIGQNATVEFWWIPEDANIDPVRTGIDISGVYLGLNEDGVEEYEYSFNWIPENSGEGELEVRAFDDESISNHTEYDEPDTSINVGETNKVTLSVNISSLTCVLVGEVGDGCVRLSWSYADSAGDVDADILLDTQTLKYKYNITEGGTSPEVVISIDNSDRWCELSTNLANGTEYTFWVEAVDVHGNDDLSSNELSLTPQSGSVPHYSITSLSGSAGYNSAYLKWRFKDFDDVDMTDSIGFLVHRGDTLVAALPIVIGASTNYYYTYADENLDYDTTYTYYVTVIDKWNYQSESISIDVTTGTEAGTLGNWALTEALFNGQDMVPGSSNSEGFWMPCGAVLDPDNQTWTAGTTWPDQQNIIPIINEIDGQDPEYSLEFLAVDDENNFYEMVIPDNEVFAVSFELTITGENLFNSPLHVLSFKNRSENSGKCHYVKILQNQVQVGNRFAAFYHGNTTHTYTITRLYDTFHLYVDGSEIELQEATLGNEQNGLTTQPAFVRFGARSENLALLAEWHYLGFNVGLKDYFETGPAVANTTRPNSVSGLSADASVDGQVTLSWLSVTSAATYLIKFDEMPDYAAYLPASEGTSATLTLPLPMNYTAKVYAVRSDGVMGASSSQGFTITSSDTASELTIVDTYSETDGGTTTVNGGGGSDWTHYNKAIHYSEFASCSTWSVSFNYAISPYQDINGVWNLSDVTILRLYSDDTGDTYRDVIIQPEEISVGGASANWISGGDEHNFCLVNHGESLYLFLDHEYLATCDSFELYGLNIGNVGNMVEDDDPELCRPNIRDFSFKYGGLDSVEIGNLSMTSSHLAVTELILNNGTVQANPADLSWDLTATTTADFSDISAIEIVKHEGELQDGKRANAKQYPLALLPARRLDEATGNFVSVSQFSMAPDGYPFQFVLEATPINKYGDRGRGSGQMRRFIYPRTGGALHNNLLPEQRNLSTTPWQYKSRRTAAALAGVIHWPSLAVAPYRLIIGDENDTQIVPEGEDMIVQPSGYLSNNITFDDSWAFDACVEFGNFQGVFFQVFDNNDNVIFDLERRNSTIKYQDASYTIGSDTNHFRVSFTNYLGQWLVSVHINSSSQPLVSINLGNNSIGEVRFGNLVYTSYSGSDTNVTYSPTRWSNITLKIDGSSSVITNSVPGSWQSIDSPGTFVEDASYLVLRTTDNDLANATPDHDVALIAKDIFYEF